MNTLLITNLLLAVIAVCLIYQSVRSGGAKS